MVFRTTDELQVDIGQRAADLETPCLLADVERMERNIREYAAVADEQG